MKQNLTLDDIIKLHQGGNLALAKQAYLNLLQQQPENVTALHMLGVLYAEEDETVKAVEYLQKALTLDPDDLSITLHLANLFKVRQEYAKAEEILLALINRQPNFAAAYNNLGTLYFSQEKWQEAVNAYLSAIKVQANYVDAYYNLGLAFAKAKRRLEAMNAYKALLELAPEHPGGQFQLGCLYLEQKNYSVALNHFKNIEAKHPFHFETQVNLAHTYLQLGKLNEAKAHYAKALEISPDDLQVIFNLGVINMQQGRIDDAQRFYLRAVTADPSMFAAHNNLAVTFLALKNADAALLHFREALRIQPTNEAIRHTINILLHQQKLHASPPEYIQALFDSYAEHYDAHLTQTLQYRVPQLMYQMVTEFIKPSLHSLDILDLGCGTGLAGEIFKVLGRTLTGIDISAKMLEVAKAKNIYTETIQVDMATHFTTITENSYDLIIAADVLVYFGDLADVLASVSKMLRANGLFIFNTEISDQKDYEITASGRFIHSKDYIEKLATRNQLTLLQHRVVSMRTQEEAEVMGHLYLLQKQP